MGGSVGGDPFGVRVFPVAGYAVVGGSVVGPAYGAVGVSGLWALVDFQVGRRGLAVGDVPEDLPALPAVGALPYRDPVDGVRLEAREGRSCGAFGKGLCAQVLEVAVLVDERSGYPPLVVPVGVVPFDVDGAGGIGLAFDRGGGVIVGCAAALRLVFHPVVRCLFGLCDSARPELHGVLHAGFEIGEGVGIASGHHDLPLAAPRGPRRAR